MLIFFGAFIPQFVNPKGDYVTQVILLGATAMFTAAITDGSYAILTGRARSFLTRACADDLETQWDFSDWWRRVARADKDALSLNAYLEIGL